MKNVGSKGGRNISSIADFSGGLNTKASLIEVDTKFSPDCLNVYAEGKKLVKRKGISKLNSVAVGTSPTGNGMYDWVRTGSSQLLMGYFGNKLYSMDVVGAAWDGTWDAVSHDAANGAPFTDSIMHFVNYSSTLIMTTEARDKPQYIRPIDSSHFNIEYLGSGTGVLAKYPQVWKSHLWLMNIGAGGALTEDFDSIASWTTSGGGALSQTTLGGAETAKFVALATVSDATLTRDIGTIADDYTVEFRTYFEKLESVSATSTSTGYAHFQWDNGATRVESRFSDDGLEIYDGAAWNEVGVNVVEESFWATWKFIVTGGTATAATINITKDGSYIGVGLDATSAAASTASNGEIQLTATGSTGTGATIYVDYMYINTGESKTEYFTDGDFSAWDSATVPTTPNLIAYPTQPLVHMRMNDNAASTVITNDGVEGTDAVASSNTDDLTNASGKIGRSITLTSASSHSIDFASATVTSMVDDNVGTVSCWVKKNGEAGGMVLGVSNDATNSQFQYQLGGNGVITLTMEPSINQIDTPTGTISSGSWTHLVLTQDATSYGLYVNGAAATYSVTLGSGSQGLWFNDLTGPNTVRIGAREISGGGPSSFLNADFDDFRYYSSVLSTREIASIYAEGSGTEAYATTARGGTVVIGTYAYEFTQDGVGSANGISQVLASSNGLAGADAIVGAWVNATNLSTYKLRTYDGTTNTDSAVFTANGTWQYQVLPFTPSGTVTSLEFQVISTSAATVQVDQVSIIDSSTLDEDDNSDRVQRTATATYNDFDGVGSGYDDLVTPGDVGVTGSFILQDKMFITKKWSIHQFEYTGSTPLVDIKQIRAAIGTNSPRSIKNIQIAGEGAGEVVIFLGTDRRLYRFAGVDAVPISDQISVTNGLAPVYMDNINAQQLDKVYAVVHNDLNWYELFVPIGNSTVPDYSIVYDYLTGALWVHSNRNFTGGCVSDDGGGQRKVYAQGASNGFAYLINDTNADDGATIDGYWTSFKAGDGMTLSQYDEVDVHTESNACTPIFSWRCDYESSYITKTMAASTNKHNWNPGRMDNLIQFKIEDDSTDVGFKLWSIGLNQRTIGGGK